MGAMKHATKKQQKDYNGFAIPILPDTQLGLAMLIAEDEEGHTQPVGVASTINEAKEIAHSDLAAGCANSERGNDAGLCPYEYKVWAQGIDGDYRIAATHQSNRPVGTTRARAKPPGDGRLFSSATGSPDEPAPIPAATIIERASGPLDGARLPPVNACHRRMITSQYLGSSSISRACRPVFSQAMIVVPDPPNGSRIVSRLLLLFRSARSTNSTGFIVGCSRLAAGRLINHTSP